MLWQAIGADIMGVITIVTFAFEREKIFFAWVSIGRYLHSAAAREIVLGIISPKPEILSP